MYFNICIFIENTGAHTYRQPLDLYTHTQTQSHSACINTKYKHIKSIAHVHATLTWNLDFQFILNYFMFPINEQSSLFALTV